MAPADETSPEQKPAQVRTAPAMLVSLFAFVAFAGTGAMALGGSPSSASHVSCGATITADTTLDSDLVDCPNHGIVIGADDITLDMNGHLVDGDGAPGRRVSSSHGADWCDFGVFNNGHDGVTVEGWLGARLCDGRARRARHATTACWTSPHHGTSSSAS